LKEYNFFKNTKYALDGIKTLLHEKAFLIELFIIIPLFILLYFLPLDIESKITMGASLFVIFIAEALNTAIEYTVDLVTNEYHELAKKAKDTASAGVFFSIALAIFVWGINLYFAFTTK
jgi:diacylglycerol kinase